MQTADIWIDFVGKNYKEYQHYRLATNVIKSTKSNKPTTSVRWTKTNKMNPCCCRMKTFCCVRLFSYISTIDMMLKQCKVLIRMYCNVWSINKACIASFSATIWSFYCNSLPIWWMYQFWFLTWCLSRKLFVHITS